MLRVVFNPLDIARRDLLEWPIAACQPINSLLTKLTRWRIIQKHGSITVSVHYNLHFLCIGLYEQTNINMYMKNIMFMQHMFRKLIAIARKNCFE